jgi:hypothetical protein
MAENLCQVCRETFTTTTGRPPDPPICEDCQFDNWNGKAPEKRMAPEPSRNEGVIEPMPQRPSRGRRKKRRDDR